MFAKRHRPERGADADPDGALAGRLGVRGGPSRARPPCSRDSTTRRCDAAVPACPEWSVGDLLAHLVGVAEDAARGAYFADATRGLARPGTRRRPGRPGPRDTWTGTATGPVTACCAAWTTTAADW